MPKPSRRVRSRRRLSRTSPGHKRRIHYAEKAASPPICGLCRKPIAGVSRLYVSKKRKVNQTQKRINRPYGRQLCPKCLRAALRDAVHTI